MLRNASKVNGYDISASDGKIGTVSDFLFDDAGWSIRWLVVDTSNWFSGRKVLLPVSSLGKFDTAKNELAVRLTRQQVKDSPDIDTDRPISRQTESTIFDYYGATPYWGPGMGMGMGMGMGAYGGGMLDAGGVMMGAPVVGSGSNRPEDDRAGMRGENRHRDEDPHLRSIHAVTGYHIHATDGEIGHVEDFLIGDNDWRIHFLVVDTTNWWPGRKVLIPPASANAINWSDELVELSYNRQKVKDSPTYDPSTSVDSAYDETLDSYYGVKPVPGARPQPPAGS